MDNAQFLNIQRLIVIGIGFSVPAGEPVMRDFFPYAWEEAMRAGSGLGGHDRDWAVFCRVRQLWEDWQAPDEEKGDLERFAMHVAASAADYAEDLVYFICRVCDLAKEKKVGCKCSPVWSDVYLTFSREMHKRRDDLAILSFNYDLLPDQALLQIGCSPQYCLPGEYMHHMNWAAKPRDELVLLKPHGSFNWLVCENQACRRITIDWSPGPKNEKRCGNWQGRGLHPAHGHVGGERLFQIVLPPEHIGIGPTQSRWPANLIGGVREACARLFPRLERILFLGWSAPETDLTWRKWLSWTVKPTCRIIVANAVAKRKDQVSLKARYLSFLKERNVKFFLGHKGVFGENFAATEWWGEFIS